MVTYCSNPQVGYFSVMTGHGVPAGMVKLHAGGPGVDNKCERYDEIMTRDEAYAEGLRQGYLVEFRSTDSFFRLAATFYQRGPYQALGGKTVNPFEDLCKREELDPDAVYLQCVTRGLI